MTLLLLFLSFGPSLIWLYWLWSRDRFQREPLGLIALLMAGGGTLAVVLTLKVVPVYEALVPAVHQSAFVNMLLVAALPEELFKLLPVLVIAWRSRHWIEPFDGIVYAGAVALGFHLIETSLYMYYALESGISDSLYQGLIRGVKPGHMLYGVAMGYFLSKARFAAGWWQRVRSLALALALPVALHTAWNTANLHGGSFVGGATLHDLVFSVIAWALSVGLWVTAHQHVRHNQERSPYNPNLTVAAARTRCPVCHGRYPRAAAYCPVCGTAVA